MCSTVHTLVTAMLDMNQMMLRSMMNLKTVESSHQHNCHAETTCTNTPAASSTCACNSSFWEGDGETSTDVHECDESVSLKHDCDGANELCSNKDNGFDCVGAAGYERATAGDANSECESIRVRNHHL